MPPRKSRGRGKGRGKKKAEETHEEVDKTDESQDDSTVDDSQTSENDTSVNASNEEEPTSTEDSRDTAEKMDDDSANENGAKKRKAESDDDEEEEEEEEEVKVKKEKKEKKEKKKNKKVKREEPEEDSEESEKPITLFCGNLDPDLTTESLQAFFDAEGIDITNARKISFKRFGYVDVKPEDLDKALELSGKELNGEPVRIDLSKPKAGNEPQEKQVTGGDSKTLFVKNLVEDITEEEIRAFFEGETITEIRLPKKYNGTSKGFGYVVFENDEAAEKMMKEKQGAELKGEKIFLDYTNEKSQHSQGSKNKEFGPSKVLFVRNLSFQVTEDELKEIFEGSKACRIPPNEYGQSKGFGFVEFESVEDAEKAKAEKDGLEIQGREVQLAFANDKPGGFMGGGGFGGGGGGGRGGRGGFSPRGGWGGRQKKTQRY
ncbi:nucleolin-like isoform X1 [Dreissena polymorpha]|uniref:nucleolin-like isoform X1 n=1 Tax=Dreissena polymorpha TaxID=45954 RepID=UPI0022645AF7|nr:nucleolin-like isoform X1 [Dreissena polymorpha]